MTLTDDLTRTAALLAAGWPITSLARAKRAQERQQMTATDQTTAILDRLTTAHGVINDFDFTHGNGNDFDDALDVIDSIRDCGDRVATELVDTLATLAALLSDAGTEIARLSAENAGLRAREGR